MSRPRRGNGMKLLNVAMQFHSLRRPGSGSQQCLGRALLWVLVVLRGRAAFAASISPRLLDRSGAAELSAVVLAVNEDDREPILFEF